LKCSHSIYPDNPKTRTPLLASSQPFHDSPFRKRLVLSREVP